METVAGASENQGGAEDAMQQQPGGANQMQDVVFEMLPINVEPGQTHTLTEYDKRMKRAARFGIDPTKVAGPQAQQTNATEDDEMDVDQAFDKMATGAGAPKVDKIQEQIERIRKRQERFGEDVEEISKSKINKLNKRITSLKAFEKPAEIQADAQIKEDTLYLYGTDFMSTRDIKFYVGTQFPEVQIKWINDSSCTLIFQSQEEAEQAYLQFSVRPAALKVNLETTGEQPAQQSAGETVNNAEEGQTVEEKEAQQRKVDERNFDSKLGWREALAFEHPLKGWQHLWIRFATDLDVKKDETRGQNSRFYKFQTRTSQQTRGSRDKRSGGSRYGNHPGDRRQQDREPARLGKKQIQKPEKYRQRRRGQSESEDDESSDIENNNSGDKSDAALPIDDGNTRSEVDVNFISKSAGILKAETMQEDAAATKVEGAGDDWGGEDDKIEL